MKKHFRQMTKDERRFLYSIVRNTVGWKFTPYSIERALERIVNEDNVLKAIEKGTLVEYHNKDGKHRVLLRGVQIVDGKYVVCVVVEPATKNVVTVFINEYNDTHTTLRWSAYNGNINIVEEMKGETVA
jgi:hypothetical protein